MVVVVYFVICCLFFFSFFFFFWDIFLKSPFIIAGIVALCVLGAGATTAAVISQTEPKSESYAVSSSATPTNIPLQTFPVKEEVPPYPYEPVTSGVSTYTAFNSQPPSYSETVNQ